MRTSKSALTVARMALEAASAAVPLYARRNSPKLYTQPQLLVCLVIKEFLRLDYRGVETLLNEWSDLREVLGLKRVPRFTTLQTASRRLLCKPSADACLQQVLAQCRKAKLLKRRTARAAIDSTGMETRHVSAYYTKRCGRHKGHLKHRYPEVTVICDTRNHLILGAVTDRGPKPDACEFEKTLIETLKQQWFTTLIGDAGYESEAFHSVCRDDLGIRSIFPTTSRGRPRKDGKPRQTTGHYRRQMKRRFPKKTYSQRWQVETVSSMLKRNQGPALRSRSYHAQCREVRLRILTHNLAVLLLPKRSFGQSRTLIGLCLP